jgi:hypothetical protein
VSRLRDAYSRFVTGRGTLDETIGDVQWLLGERAAVIKLLREVNEHELALYVERGQHRAD